MNQRVLVALRSLLVAAPLTFGGAVLANSPNGGAAAPVVADAADGKALYTDSCTKCHGDDGRGQTRMGDKFRADGKKMPDLAASTSDRATVAKIIAEGVAETPMKGYAKKMTPEELEAVVAYTMGLRASK